MGCDIHFYKEVKIKGKWLCYGESNISRCYSLFAKMANVRNYEDLEPISEPKGIPSDLSEMVQFQYDRHNSDWHTPSWLNAEEITELEDWMEKNTLLASQCLEEEYWGYYFGNTWGGVSKYPDSCPEGIEDIRFVFWFDN